MNKMKRINKTYEATKLWWSPSSAVIRLSGLNWRRRRSKSRDSSVLFGIKFSNDFFGLKLSSWKKQQIFQIKIYCDDARSNTLGPYCDEILAISDWLGVGIWWRIRSNWLNVDVPWNKGFPSNISPKIQPENHSKQFLRI
jgi:hypothetical protein